MAVSFIYGSQSQYDKLRDEENIVSDALYFINDSQSIYRGTECIVHTPIKFVEQLPEALEEETLYVVNTSDAVDIYLLKDDEPYNIIESNIQDIFNRIAKFTSSDVKKKGLDIADDSTLATAGAVREALEWTTLIS